MNIEGLEELIRASQERIEALKACKNEKFEADVSGVANAIREFAESGRQLVSESELLKIGIVGQVKAGKSSFLNSLFFNGESVLPKASTPMTAGLTIMEYAEENSFEVEYFTREDWQVFEGQASAYRQVANDVKANMPGADEVTMRREIESKTSEEVRSGYELVSMAGSQARAKIGAKNDVNSFGTIADLQNVLERYVGASGEYMPVVKSLHIRLHDDKLEGLRIVDTPGVNDPVVSRENRTRQILQTCHGVFLLSAASDFLGSGDVAFLNNRIGASGIGTVVLLASKFDAVLQDIGAEVAMGARSEVSLPRVAEEQVRRFKSRLREQMSQIEDARLRDKIVLDTTSGIGFSIATKSSDRWDNVEQQVVKQMKRFYPDFFSTDEDVKENFMGLSNIGDIREKYVEGTFKGNKDRIIAERVEAFVSANRKGIGERLQEMEKSVALYVHQLEEVTVEEIAEQRRMQAAMFENLKNEFRNIIGAFSNTLQDQADTLGNDIRMPEVRLVLEKVDIEVMLYSLFRGTYTSKVPCEAPEATETQKAFVESAAQYEQQWRAAWEKLFTEGEERLYNELLNKITEFQKKQQTSLFNHVYYRVLLEGCMADLKKSEKLKNIDELVAKAVRGVEEDMTLNREMLRMENKKKDDAIEEVKKVWSGRVNEARKKLNQQVDGFRGALKIKTKENAESAVKELDKLRDQFSEKLTKEGEQYLAELEKNLREKTESLQRINDFAARLQELSSLYK